MADDVDTTPPSEVTWYYYTDPGSNVTGIYDDIIYDVNNNNTANVTTLNCNDWLDAQHVLFQLANLCFCVSFLTPNSFRFHMLLVRGTLSLGCLFLVIWGGAVVCLVDILTWYLLFLIINVTHLGFLVCKLYPIHLHPTLEDLYFRSFKPFRVSRYQFKELTAHAQVKDLPAGAAYALETSSKAGQRVAVLLTGRLKVSYENIFLHYIEPCQFIDSPEYEAVPNEEDCDTFQVSISALEDSIYLSWPIHQLQLYLKSKPFLSAIFTNLVGKDITHKLYQVQELLVSRPDNVKVLASRNSTVQVRQRLSQSLSIPNMHLELHLTTDTAPCSNTDNGVSHSNANSKPRVPTPVGPYSPSQVSFETCV